MRVGSGAILYFNCMHSISGGTDDCSYGFYNMLVSILIPILTGTIEARIPKGSMYLYGRYLGLEVGI